MKKIPALIISMAVTLSILAVPTANAEITYQETINSVVQIWAVDSNGEYSWGSGFFISVDGVILTNAHVILDYVSGMASDEITICTIASEYSLPDCKYIGEVLAYDEYFDLALVAPAYELDYSGNIIGDYLGYETNLGVPYVDLADYNPSIGDKLTVLGFPGASLSTAITLTEGIVSGFTPLSILLPEVGDGWIWEIETDAIINPGNSGGPAYNEDERVIGVVYAVSTSGIGGNYGYILSNDLVYFWFLELVEQGVLSETFVTEAFSNDFQEYDGNSEDIDWSQIQDSPEVDINDWYSTTNSTFNDVDLYHFNYYAIDYLNSLGVINGYPDGTFKPDGETNRAELMTMVVSMMKGEVSVNTYNNCFPDVTTQWFAPYVCYAATEGWVDGYPDGTFKPEKTTNRAEAIKIMLNAYYGGENLIPELDKWHLFNLQMPFDVNGGEWYYSFLEFATATYLLDYQHAEIYNSGAYKYFAGENITRKEVAETIYRLLLGWGEYGEKEAFIDATVEATCLLLSYDDMFAPEAEQAMNDLYSWYGFDPYDDEWMERLAAQIENDQEANDAIISAIEACPYYDESL